MESEKMDVSCRYLTPFLTNSLPIQPIWV